MPQLDRTFSDQDILRIIENHLTATERENVLLGLSIVNRRSLLEELLEELTDFLPLISTILDIADLFGILFNRADLDRSRSAVAFITDRRNALRRALDGQTDF